MIRTVICCILLLFFCRTAWAHEELPAHSVLVVHSYHKDMQWVKEVHLGIERGLFDALGDGVDIKVEYMDSKRYVSEAYNALIADLWRYKYKALPPELIIVCDDNAFNMVLGLRDDVFKGIPIVFCGVNVYDPGRFETLKNVTGVIEAYDLRGTLDIIKTLMPDRKRLFIINDSTTTGMANKRRFEEISYEYNNHFQFMYSGDISAETLAKTVRTLQQDTAILLMSFNRDYENHILRYRDAARIVRNNSTQPLFGVWSFYLDRGIVGGSLVSGQSQGEKAAELAVSILQGTPASSLPILKESPNLPMFDYKELERFAIDTSLLPKNSVIINTPNTLWHRYQYVILSGLGIFLLQLAIIALLIYNIRLRRKSEEMLLKNQQNLAITLEAIGEGVVSVDSKLNIIRANPSAGNLFETPYEKMPGNNLTKLLVSLDETTGEMLAGIVKECCRTGKSLQIPDKTILRPSGRPAKHLSGTCSPIEDQRSGIVGAVLICHDITEREAIQAMLAHSQKMEAIGQLAGGVAHDFNNLLTGISGFAELLSIQLRDDEQKSATANKIIGAAGRARDLTRQLLSFARKGKIISSPVDCHEALLSAIGLLERSIDKKTTLKSLLNAEKTTIMGDPVQLENIFLNLGINGADAMSDGGTLTFATTNRNIIEETACEFGETLEPGEYLVVTVKDTGCGIKEDARQAIFEPFFTTKESGKGTGLGLSAVFGAMKEHSGRIRLHSEVGSGTEFELFFPIGVQHDEIQPVQLPEIEGGRETILVIDDEHLVLSSAEGLLKELGYRVILATGCGEGLAKYEMYKQEVDVVILDMIMPEMDGSHCYAELKRVDPQVRTIISSGYARTERIKEVERLGAKGFLQKPYSAASLSKAIREAMSPG